MTKQKEAKLAVLLHADVMGSTELVQRDEALAHEKIQQAFHHLSGVITAHQGIAREIRGDALVAEFSRASDAVSAAVAFQNEHAERNAVEGGEKQPWIRIGIAMGEVIVADNTVTGSGVVLAQRIEQLATQGGICIQGAVYETLPKRLPFFYRNLGEKRLKGFAETVRVYAASSSSLDTTEATYDQTVEHRPLEIPQKPSIAVLPFSNMSNDSEQAFFADGISEDIITELSKFRSFFVIARNSSFVFKDEPVPIREVGVRLGVRYVVEGSVRKAGNRVRITAQLIDAVDDKHLWAERFDRDLEDIFEVQDEVTRAIVTSIEPQLATTERQRARRKPTANLDAWECYQRGLWHMFSYRDVDEALHYFGRAMELDPQFSSPYAGIAYTYAQKILLGVSKDREKDLQDGINAAETAIRLDRTDPFGYFAQGRITLFGGQHEKAIDAFRHAIDLNPNYALAHFGLAHGLWHAGRPSEALTHHDEAIRLSPHDPILWAFLASKAIALTMTGRFEEGVALSLEAQRSEGSNPFSYLAEVSGYGLLGNMERAKDALGRLESIQPDISMDFVRSSLPILDSEARDLFFRGLISAGMKNETAEVAGTEITSP